MSDKKLYKILSKYCIKITTRGNHYKAYIDETRFIVISSTCSDWNHWRQVYRDFRRKGVIISELLKS